MKKVKKLTARAKKFILKKITEGFDVSEICTSFSDIMPPASVVYASAIEDEEFAAQLNRAYGALFLHRVDEARRLATMSTEEAYPDVEDWRQAEAALKRRLDEAKFALTKIAPLLSSKFDKVKPDSKKNAQESPVIQILNYSVKEIENKGGENE